MSSDLMMCVVSGLGLGGFTLAGLPYLYMVLMHMFEMFMDSNKLGEKIMTSVSMSLMGLTEGIALWLSAKGVFTYCPAAFTPAPAPTPTDPDNTDGDLFHW